MNKYSVGLLGVFMTGLYLYNTYPLLYITQDRKYLEIWNKSFTNARVTSIHKAGYSFPLKEPLIIGTPCCEHRLTIKCDDEEDVPFEVEYTSVWLPWSLFKFKTIAHQ